MLKQTLSGHADWVTSVAVSPDGSTLVSASRDRTLKLWSREGTLIKTLGGHTGWINRVRFSPDGNTFASASEDGTVRLWKRDGTPLKTLDLETLNSTSVNSTSANSTSANPQKQAADTPAATTVRITDLAFSPNGQALAATRADGTFQLWTLPTGTLQYQISQTQTDTPTAQNQLSAVTFSPDGQTLAVAGANAQIQRWRAADGLQLDPLLGHTGEVTGLSFNPDGTLASSSTDGTVRLWDVRSPSPLADLGIHSISVSPAATPPTYSFATADFEGDVTLWEHSPKSKTTTVLRKLSGHQGAVEAVAFNPAGTHVVSAGSDNQVILWRVAEGTRLATATDHGERVTSAAFSPDGKLLATGGADKTLRLWSVTDANSKTAGENPLTLLATLTGHTDEVTSVSFHPRRPLLLSGSYDKTVRLWQIPKSGQTSGTAAGKATLLQTMSEPNEAVSTVQFSPTGDRIAAASWDSQLYLWQLQGQSPQLQSTLGPHDGGVSSLTFSADGHTLISGSANGVLQLWNLETKQTFKRLMGEAGTVNEVSLSADTQLLVSGAKQGGIGLWSLQLPMLMETGCDRLESYLRNNPTLTDENRTLCEPLK